MKTPVEAAVVAALCAKSHLGFGIRVERASAGVWRLTWAFAIDSSQSQREGYGAQRLDGSFHLGESYPGCPHCRAKSIFQCSCQTLGCWDGAKSASCASCSQTCEITRDISALSSKGDY
jgi:hypothetical protein